MTYSLRDRGLYHVKRHSLEKGVDHHAILDIGNSRRQPGAGDSPAIFHLTYPALRSEWLAHTAGGWQVVQQIQDIGEALRRLAEASRRPRYSLLFNNCEHFAHHVASSKRESPQLAKAFGVVVLGGLIVWSISSAARGQDAS